MAAPGQSVLDVLCDFLEGITHHILYIRKLYPEELNNYLSELIGSVRAWVAHGRADQLVLVVMDDTHHPLERFVFDIALDLHDQDAMQHDTVHMLDATQLAALEKQLSSIATRLSMSQLRPLPPGCVFELVVHSHDAQPPRAAQTTPGGDGEPLWLDAHPDQDRYVIADKTLVPIRSADVPPLSLQLRMELPRDRA